MCRTIELACDPLRTPAVATSDVLHATHCWLATNAVSVAACVVVVSLRGWARFQAACFVLLWALLTGGALEFYMACLARKTMLVHIAANHVPVRASGQSGAAPHGFA